MKLKLLFFICISLFTFSKVFAQQDSLALRTQSIAKVDSIQGNFKEYNPLAPAKAAFFSAIFPGLGQIYNGSYWKLPIVYGALGTSVYFYIENDKQYNRYRDAYKRRLAGYNDDEFQDRLDNDALINAQKHFRRNKEISILVTAAFYILNIVDANVDAHLQQFNVSNDLSMKPNFKYDQFTGRTNYGLSFNLNF